MDMIAATTIKFKTFSQKGKPCRRDLIVCKYCDNKGHSIPTYPNKTGKSPSPSFVRERDLDPSVKATCFTNIKSLYT